MIAGAATCCHDAFMRAYCLPSLGASGTPPPPPPEPGRKNFVVIDLCAVGGLVVWIASPTSAGLAVGTHLATRNAWLMRRSPVDTRPTTGARQPMALPPCAACW